MLFPLRETIALRFSQTDGLISASAGHWLNARTSPPMWDLGGFDACFSFDVRSNLMYKRHGFGT